MTFCARSWIVSALNFRNLRGRFWQSLVIVVGMACVIGVLLSMLSMTEGMHDAYLTTGDPGRAIVVSNGADSESISPIARAIAPLIDTAPGITKDVDGRPIADRGIDLGRAAIKKKRHDALYLHARLRAQGAGAAARISRSWRDGCSSPASAS